MFVSRHAALHPKLSIWFGSIGAPIGGGVGRRVGRERRRSCICSNPETLTWRGTKTRLSGRFENLKLGKRVEDFPHFQQIQEPKEQIYIPY